MPRTAPTTLLGTVSSLGTTSGVANIIQQLALPPVGEGVSESRVVSGSPRRYPIKRARTTGQYLALAVAGNDEDRAAMRAAVAEVHRHVRSGEHSPVAYNANAADLQLWVAACLFVGLEDTYQLLRGEMSTEQAEQFYQSAATLGTTLQVTQDQWPATRVEFDSYWDAACRQVAIDDVVGAYLHDLVALKMVNPLLRVPFRPLLRFLTAGFLAPVFRDALGVGWGPARQVLFERLFLLVSFGNRFLPVFLRQGGSYLLLADVRRRARAGRPLI